jgi:Tfp pilus assembly protein PilF
VKREFATVLLAGILGAGCTALPVTGSAPSNGTAASTNGAELPAATGISGAAAALLGQSHAQRDAGDLGGAAATVERALTISPDEALLWVELGEIRLDQGNAGLAAEMARKALTLTSDNSAVADRARRLLR